MSGGSWAGVPFTYLTAGTTDDQYLGTFVDPSQLTPESLASLPTGNIGSQVTEFFTIPDIAITSVLLYLMSDGQLAPNMLWQSVIGLHMLLPYGLYDFESLLNVTPASYFTYDSTTKAAIVQANPGLANVPGNVVSTSGQTRPYLVCNMAMFVKVNGETLLAPLPSTPFITGIVGAPPHAVDANGRQVGGGGVTSFASSSVPSAVSGSSVTVQQSRQMSLVDIVGTSSSAFAVAFEEINAPLYQQLEDWKHQLQMRDHNGILKAMGNAGKHLPRLLQHASASSTLLESKYIQAVEAAAAVEHKLTLPHFGIPGISIILEEILHAIETILSDLVPKYQYWPVSDVPAEKTVNPTLFADGGLLENSGIASVLAYSDVDNVIAFINSITRLSQQTVQGKSVVVVDDSIPPLFGFQPFSATEGYVPYSKGSSGIFYKNNQIFDSSAFEGLLNGLWRASGSGSYSNSPVFSQNLTTINNPWFGVAEGRSITVVWAYLESATAWFNSLSPQVQSLVPPNFPHYSTVLETQLTPTQVNLLANFTAWNVSSANADQFEAVFKQAMAAHASGGGSSSMEGI